MRQQASYSEEIKAAAMAALLAGQSVSAVAREYKIPKGTVSGWKKQAEEKSNNSTQKKEIGSLLLDYLRTNLQTLKKQSEVFSDERWLKKQSASEVAVLHGVLADKTIRLLEALADQEESPEADGQMETESGTTI